MAREVRPRCTRLSRPRHKAVKGNATSARQAGILRHVCTMHTDTRWGGGWAMDGVQNAQKKTAQTTIAKVRILPFCWDPRLDLPAQAGRRLDKLAHGRRWLLWTGQGRRGRPQDDVWHKSSHSKCHIASAGNPTGCTTQHRSVFPSRVVHSWFVKKEVIFF